MGGGGIHAGGCAGGTAVDSGGGVNPVWAGSSGLSSDIFFGSTSAVDGGLAAWEATRRFLNVFWETPSQCFGDGEPLGEVDVTGDRDGEGDGERLGGSQADGEAGARG
jgi:hypothetical protein